MDKNFAKAWDEFIYTLFTSFPPVHRIVELANSLVRKTIAKSAYDADGNRIYAGDTVEVWTTRDNDGYNCDPELDERVWGYFEVIVIEEIGSRGGSVKSVKGGWWPSAHTRLLKQQEDQNEC